MTRKRYLQLVSRLRTARKAKGLTQEELAARIHKDQSYISRVERGERRLDVFETFDLCAALEVPFYYLVPEVKELPDSNDETMSQNADS